jgi:type I restriction enzyme S subunit
MIMKKVKLGDIFKTTSGSTPLTSDRSFYDGGTISWLTSGEVGQGKITITKNFITRKALKETSVKMLPKHSVVIAMYGATVGEVGILDFETTTNQAICGILPNKEQADPFYIYYH